MPKNICFTCLWLDEEPQKIESCIFFVLFFLGKEGPVNCVFSICVSFGEQEPLTANFPAMISAKAAQKNGNDGRTCLEGRS